MPQINTILVPLELHEYAAPVVQWAAVMARATTAQLTLFHVNAAVEPFKTQVLSHGGEDIDPIAIDQWRQQYEQTARLELERLAQQYCADLSVSFLVLEGRTHAAILEELDTSAYELVVMGTHGRPWYQRILLGSTAEAVLRASRTPILIVRNTAAAPLPPQLTRVLFATDFSPAGAAGEEWLRYLAAQGVQEVLLVHAVENPLLDTYDPGHVEMNVRKLMEESRQHPPRSAQPFWDHAHEVAQAKLSRLRQELVDALLPATRVELLVGEGPAAQDILTVAERERPDLIVMATHGRTGVRHLVLGSVTEKVLRAAPCPVLAVPSKL
jgi:nucleotide-binding universal stress UspA family protein